MEQTNRQLQKIAVQGGFRELPPPGTMIYEREAQTKIEVTDYGQKWMADLHNRILKATIEKATALHLIHEQRLYAHWGFDSFLAYVGECWGGVFGARQAYYYAAIGHRIQLMLTAANEGGQDEEKIKGFLAPMSHHGWRGLLELTAEDLKKLAKGEDYVASDGRSYTLKELTEMSTRDLKEKLSRKSSDLQRLEEEARRMKAELEDYHAHEEGRSTVAQDLALKLEQVEKQMDELRGHREQTERARELIGEAKGWLEKAYQQLMVYMPRDPEELDKFSEQMIEALAVVGEYGRKFQQMSEQYERMRAQYEVG
jgi:hypothetical protein